MATRNSTGIIGLVVILVLGMVVYSSFFQNDSAILIDASGKDLSTLGADLVKIQDDLSKVSLSPDIFNDPGYRALKDFSAEVPVQPLGRPNPFDVMGR